jgi:type II secretory pathway component PulK
MNRRHRGFLLLDAVTGIFVLMMIAAAIAGAVYQHRAGEQRLLQRQQAMTFAEQALTDLQSGEPVDLNPDESTNIEVDRLPDEMDANLSGYRWFAVTARRGGQAVTLHGPAPHDALPEQGVDR